MAMKRNAQSPSIFVPTCKFCFKVENLPSPIVDRTGASHLEHHRIDARQTEHLLDRLALLQLQGHPPRPLQVHLQEKWAPPHPGSQSNIETGAIECSVAFSRLFLSELFGVNLLIIKDDGREVPFSDLTTTPILVAPFLTCHR